MKRNLLIISFLIAKSTLAQVASSGVWLSFQFPFAFNKKWQWHNDVSYRTIGLSPSAYQYIYRTGARYFLNKEIGFAGGLAFFYTRTNYLKDNHEFGKEFRWWQEVNYEHPLSNSFTLQNRVRSEERSFEQTDNKPSYHAFRFRYRIGGTQKISQHWSLQLADEYMSQSVKGHFTFNQNRVIVSAIAQLRESLRWQAGYMWLLWPSSSQHIINISIQKIINFRKAA